MTLPAPAHRRRRPGATSARCPAASGLPPQAALRASTWRTRRSTRRSWPEATSSRSCRRWPEAEHGVPHRSPDSTSRALIAAVAVPGAGRRSRASSARCGTTTAGARCCASSTRPTGRWPKRSAPRIVARGGGALAGAGRAASTGSARWTSAMPPSRSRWPAAHRDEAFAACRFVIEEVKRRVPIWKREYYADGTGVGGSDGTPSQRSRRSSGRDRSPADAHATASVGRSAASGSRSPTAATCAAATACRRRSTSGCRASRSSPSRRSIAWRGSSPGSACSKLRLTGGEPLLRHDLPDAGRAAVADARHRRSRAHDQRRPAGPPGGGAPRGRAPAGDGESRHAPARADAWRSPAAPATPTCSRASMRPIAAGFAPVKLNTVVIRGYNDDEVVDLLEFARERGAEPRFIEYMDVGGATRLVAWTRSCRSARSSSLVGARFGPVEPLPRRTPGRRPSGSRCRDGTVFGVIASTTAPFCRTCDRGRLTADGTFFLCLYGEGGLDLREPLRAGATDEEIAGRIAEIWPAGPTAEPRSARPAPTAASCTGSRACAPIRGARCTPAAADGAPRRADRAPDPAQHRQHRPALRRDRYPPPPDRAARLLARRRGAQARGPRLLGQGRPLGAPGLVRLPRRDGRSRCLYFSAKAERSFWEAPFRPNSCLVFGSETDGMPDRILEKHPGALLPHPDDRARCAASTWRPRSASCSTRRSAG